MGKKPNDVLVSRELLERLFSDEPDGYVTRMNARQELLALLAQPADQQGEPAGWAHENALKELQERKSGAWPFIAPISSHQSPLDGITVALYRHAQPATAKVDDAVRDKLRELVSAVRSINNSPRHEVRVIGDDEPCYAQRKEWVNRLLSICDDAEEVAKLNEGQSSSEPDEATRDCHDDDLGDGEAERMKLKNQQ